MMETTSSEKTKLLAEKGEDFKGNFALTIYVILACIGNLLFGYNICVVNGALVGDNGIKEYFHLSSFQTQEFVSAILVAALFGALVAGDISEKIGVKSCTQVSMVPFIIGALLSYFSKSFWVLIVSRAFSGIGIGLASAAAPQLISELSPPSSRGYFTAFPQLFVTFGIFVSYLTAWGFSFVSEGWRYSLVLSLFPASLYLICSLFKMPESPIWLLRHRSESDALAALSSVRKTQGESLQLELNQLFTSSKQNASSSDNFASVNSQTSEQTDNVSPAEQDPLVPSSSSSSSKSGWGYMLSLHRSVLIGVCIQFFQQITGINAILYYSSTIFEQSGISQPLLATCIIGATNFVVTLLSVVLVDRLGRRTLLLGSLAVMALNMLVLFLTYTIHFVALLSVVCCVLFVAGFAYGLGTIPWILVAEIFPDEARGPATSLCTAVNWGTNFIIGATFLTLSNAVGEAYVFLGFSCVLVVCILFVVFLIPETKGLATRIIYKIINKLPILEDA